MLLLIKITKSFGLYYCRYRIAEEKEKKKKTSAEKQLKLTAAHLASFCFPVCLKAPEKH